MSLIVLGLALGSPPVGVKVTVVLTFALPVRFSFFFALPLALIRSFTLPAALTALAAAALSGRAGRWGTTRFPARVRVPGPGTFTVSLAVPFFLFRFSLPKLNRLEGFCVEGPAAGGQGG